MLYSEAKMRQVFSENDILDAGMAVVRKSGHEAVTMRSIAHEAGCSVQPIYSMFADKESLMDALYDYALEWIREYNVEHSGDGCNELSSVGLTHIRLAQDEPNLFTFVYLSPHRKAKTMEEIAEIAEQPGIIERVIDRFNISEESAHTLYFDMAIFVHGLASLIVTGASFSIDEIREHINTVFYSIAQRVGLEWDAGWK